MSCLDIRIIDLTEKEKNELYSIIVLYIEADSRMRNIVMMFIEMSMITIKQGKYFNEQTTGYDIGCFIIDREEWFEWTLDILMIDEESSDKLLVRLRKGEF